MAQIVILGAGPTGLSAAYHLEQNNFYDYKLFEKEQNVGGLCRSVYQDGFTFDFTGHLLHISDNYFKQFLESTIEFENLNKIYRRSFIYSQDIYTVYPYQINLYGLPIDTITDCITGYINKPKYKKEPKNFYNWVLKSFGSGFGKYFFFPYQKKIFSYDIKKISASWTGRFVPNTSLADIIKGSVYDRSSELFGYNSQFFYPKINGINFWITKIASKIKNQIYTNYTVESIDTVNKIIKFTNGAQENFKIIITTIPLDQLLLITKLPANNNLSSLTKNLICNSVINFNLGINRENLSDKHWIYFPEDKYPFYRIGFPHNFSGYTVPAGHSSLYGEFSYIKKSIKKSSNYINQTLNLALEQTKKLLKIDQSEIVTEKIIPINYAYVIYNSWRDKNINKILSRLKEYNIYSIGRFGAWKYSSMQEAILDGKTEAEDLLNKL